MNPEALKERIEIDTDLELPIGRVALVDINEAESSDMDEEGIHLQDTRIEKSIPLIEPIEVQEKYPLSKEARRFVAGSRQSVVDIIHGKDSENRLLVVVGPCSIHDPKAALEYADFIAEMQPRYSKDLFLVMRTYLEKPRTTFDWRGLIDDPDLDNSFDVNKGLEISRELMVNITEKGVPVSTELVDPDTVEYFDDLITWAAIGARNTESQKHRSLVSGISFPVGFKNGTGGNIQIAIDGMVTASVEQSFIGQDKQGRKEIHLTKGNGDTHIILRGGKPGPNFDPKSVQATADMMGEYGLDPSIMIDMSHANSGKEYLRQMQVVQSVASQVSKQANGIRGVMIESNLEEGKQSRKKDDGTFKNMDELTYGQSITDACVDLGDTREMFDLLARSVQSRRLR